MNVKTIFKFKRKIKHANVGRNCLISRNLRTIGEEYLTINNNVFISYGGRIELYSEYNGTHFKPSVLIKNNVKINENFYLSCINKIEIGEGCLFGSNVFISDNSHGRGIYEELEVSPNERPLFSKGPVKIGKNCWIGQNACILSGVTLGDSVIVGAGSIVTKSFDNNCVIAGNPAKKIKDWENE